MPDSQGSTIHGSDSNSGSDSNLSSGLPDPETRRQPPINLNSFFRRTDSNRKVLRIVKKPNIPLQKRAKRAKPSEVLISAGEEEDDPEEMASGKTDVNSNAAFENMLEQHIVNMESSEEDHEEDSDLDDMEVVLDDEKWKNWTLFLGLTI